jgi:hypothetical protein
MGSYSENKQNRKASWKKFEDIDHNDDFAKEISFILYS